MIGIKQLQGGNMSSSQLLATPNAHILIAAYWEHFHPALPILHRATFNMQEPSLLVEIVVAVGSIYMATTLEGDSAASCLRMGQNLWEAGCNECQNLVRDGWTNWQQPAVLQVWILHIVYGTYMGYTAHYQKAKNLLRSLVDYVQDHRLLAQSVVFPGQSTWMHALAANTTYADEEELRYAWHSYVDEESTKLCMYTLQLLDFHTFYPCNLRCLTSAMDFDWALPHSAGLWEAENAGSWIEVLREDVRVQAMLDPDDHLCLPCPSTKSLSLAIQSLMSDAPSLHLLSALESSPITIIFLLTMLDALIRDLTRSLYQLPPALADPSPYHILSQNQNRQMAAALQQVTRLAEEQPESSRRGVDGPVWTAIERLSLAIRLGLYKPDDLLIGGVIDSSVTAGLAAATHLTLGRSTGTRRSLRMLYQHNSGEDAVLLFLEEIVASLESMLATSKTEAMREAPWVTVASYRILLAIWRSLRWASSEMRRRAESNTQSHFDTSTLIFNTIIDTVSHRLEIRQDANGVPSPASVPGETCFSGAIHKFWTDRNTWTVGSSMVPILEEICSTGM
ncbi:hypothetical protein QQS21_005464 [Conoideocrella luteorostrata]|uniref:Xylanolytic transcriptional activator regulatory domain-containing protein n=1 Tax=Conoideocrella luteorostrata TaxID=1105319 RepID=A0AAJ0FTS9_9HYPO|nr:hypothetical protein QQS21_005464 [Conoideocrella luteorostrata]